jgi:hypothetical protein
MSPSPEHEALHRIFQHDPALFTRSVSRILGIPVPEPYDVSVLNVDLTEIRPVERRADSVLQVASYWKHWPRRWTRSTLRPPSSWRSSPKSDSATQPASRYGRY